jgi:hypothetical protein
VFSRLLGVGLIAGALLSPFAASADPAPAKVIQVLGSPVAVTRCTYNSDGGGYWTELANITNRSPYPLISAQVRFQFFDGEGPVGEQVFQITPRGSDVLASGDATSISNQVGQNFSAPTSTVRYATCRILSATFTRDRKWSYGQPYTAKLLPLTADR